MSAMSQDQFLIRSQKALAGRLFGLFEANPQLVALFDDADVLRYANPAFRAAFALAPDAQPNWQTMMRDCYRQRRGSLVKTKDFEAWLASATARRGKQAFRSFEADLYDGRWIWMSETVDEQHWMLCVASDITPLKQDGRELRQARDLALRAAQTDSLTGLSNRGHVLGLLDQFLAEYRDGDESLSVVLLDLDFFKRINDCQGHAVGDRVIRDFAQLLQSNCRRVDACGRVGGEEFLLLLVGVDELDAAQVVERLLAQVRASRPLIEQPAFGYTASAGMALWRSGEAASSLLKRADEALYDAKSAGRDQLVLAAPAG